MKYKNYEIHLATAEEVSDALLLAMEVFMQYTAPKCKKDGVDIFITEYYMNSSYIEACKAQRAPLYCCYDEEKMVGVVGLSEDHQSVELAYTKCDYQHKGIATALLHLLVRDVLDKFLEVDTLKAKCFTDVATFFLAFGFVKSNEEDELAELELMLKRPLDIEIKKCESDYVNDKASFHQRAFFNTYQHKLDEKYIKARTNQYYHDVAVMNGSNTLLAIYENKLVGFVTYQNTNEYGVERTGEITALYVDPEYQGYAIGRRLVESACAAIAYKRVFVHIPEVNKKAIGFFEHHNFYVTEDEREIATEDILIPLCEMLYVKDFCKLTRLEAVEERRSIRHFSKDPVDEETLIDLQNYINILNRESGLHFQIVTDNPEPFQNGLNHIGAFTNANQYFALIGPKSLTLEEKCGYYGERLVIRATEIGLGTCWVTLTYQKQACHLNIPNEEKLVAVIPFGRHEGTVAPHKSKEIEDLYRVEGAELPKWFLDGVRAASLGPSAMNQQKFYFVLMPSGKVRLESKTGVFTKIDQGIAKYQFEAGVNGFRFDWKR